jgi:hypothetical protein
MDHELDAASVRQLESHLHQCGECSKVLDDFQRVDNMVRGLPGIELNTDFASQPFRMVSETAKTGEGKRLGKLSLFERITRIVEDFVDLVGSAQSSSTGTLDEFNDFPPFSMGHIYFNLIDLPTRRFPVGNQYHPSIT